MHSSLPTEVSVQRTEYTLSLLPEGFFTERIGRDAQKGRAQLPPERNVVGASAPLAPPIGRVLVTWPRPRRKGRWENRCLGLGCLRRAVAGAFGAAGTGADVEVARARGSAATRRRGCGRGVGRTSFSGGGAHLPDAELQTDRRGGRAPLVRTGIAGPKLVSFRSWALRTAAARPGAGGRPPGPLG
ncbi:unnamed protein product [Rangifer tarandus platyrhynchus]|uniref:Uncharacterized protein n=2 Tax=Rangifer tarandus platyrhynchus TaxID=3082113 RepID=A0ACB0F745_RANTA|nr:unnamed protein product [Rangifer tarandus platyrhynchus]CAI9708652.1 unnamed protein product [Rangifer tarandus platyrhynchus]